MNNNDEIVEVVYTEEDRKIKNRRLLKLTAISGVTLLVLIVATYAWFIGVTTVQIDEFDVKVETLKGLQVSFTGNDNDWDTTGQINRTLSNEYFTNEGMKNNSWVDTSGLVPISTTGTFTSTGHLNLYSNASINAVTGGYRIRTEKIKNEASERLADDENFDVTTTSPEDSKYYITFDFFLKNTTNTQGTLPNASAYTESETEAVYLTTNSDIVLPPKENENDPDDTDGMENSMRVAFYQVAYAPLTTTASNLKTMGCTSNAGNSIVGVCSASALAANQGKTWNIWEANDEDHQPKAINNFNRLCRNRTDATTYSSTVCTPTEDPTTHNGIAFADGQSFNTYGVNQVIGTSNNVNIYDGLNTYFGTITTGEYLKEVDSFKESENVVLTGADMYNTSRNPIIRLAPNSITKIRAYIWIEGQDVDNLDYLGASKRLLINFGFTKDIYEEELESPSASASSGS